jgi:hypothetical protein
LVLFQNLSLGKLVYLGFWSRNSKKYPLPKEGVRESPRRHALGIWKGFAALSEARRQHASLELYEK